MHLTLTNCGLSPVFIESNNFLRSCCKNSKTRYKWSSPWTTSNNWTTFGWASSFNNDISLIAVDGTPSLSLFKKFCLKSCFWINFFIAF